MKPRLQLKQTVKVKVSVRTRMIYAAAGITIAAIIAGIVIFLYSNLGTSEKAYAAVSGDYRSIGTGLWSNTAIWEKYTGTTWGTAPTAPNSTNGTITIQSGNTVTVSSGVTVDQVIINLGGEIDLNTGIVLTIANGTGTDLDVTGIFKNTGVISINASAAVVFQSGGKYQHTRDGGSIPYSTWNTGSTCEILGVTTSCPEHLNQAFYNFTWKCVSQSGTVNCNGALTIVNGDFTITSTGSNQLNLSSGSTNLAIGGNYIQIGGTFSTVNTNGNKDSLFLAGNYNHSGGTIMNAGNANSRTRIIFNSTGTRTFIKSGSAVINTAGSSKVCFAVKSGCILDMANYIMDGYDFTLDAGAGLIMASPDGITLTGSLGNIQVTDARLYSQGADYTYNGASAQTAGSGLPSTVHNLTLNNSNGLTLTNTVAVSNILTLTSGIITTGSSEVNITNNSTIAIAGYTSSDYINGNLRRTISTSGTYDYPVGTATQYELATLTFNNLAVVKNMLVKFNNPHTGTTPNPGICIVNGSSVVGLLNYGFWNITPDVAITTGNYNLTLNESGYTNGGTSPNAYAIVTRPTTVLDWISSGVHNNNTQSEIGGTVTAVRTALSVTGNFAIGFSTYIMPIELVYFKAEPDNNSKVHLTWETASENNTNYFIVQRSPDHTTWENIDTVDATGNSFAMVDYSMYDEDPIKGEAYYRLKQCDVGLTYTYSDIVTVNIGEANSTLSNDFKAYPNPTQGILNISVSETTNRTMIRIYDIKGALIKEVKPVDGGHTQIDLSGNLPGIYLLKVGTGGPDDISKRIVLSQ